MGKGKLNIMNLFFEEFNLIFYTEEAAWSVLKCNQGNDVLENIEAHFLVYGQGNYVFKRKFMYYMFHWRLINFGIGVKRKITKCAPIGDWRDFALNFAVRSADFTDLKFRWTAT